MAGQKLGVSHLDCPYMHPTPFLADLIIRFWYMNHAVATSKVQHNPVLYRILNRIYHQQLVLYRINIPF